MKVFEKTYIGKCELSNRIIRSATFEGMCNNEGAPEKAYFNLYHQLSKNNIGAIITGITSVSEEGKVIHPGQACLFKESVIKLYKPITNKVHQNGSKIILQLGHAGRQTRPEFTKHQVVGVSKKASSYFKVHPHVLTTLETKDIINQFTLSAYYAQIAGFDGIQLHAAHGYLLHQFIHPLINNRKDEFGINKQTEIGTRFLELLIQSIREQCGDSFPILIKISGDDDYQKKKSRLLFTNLIKFLSSTSINAIEISYGTMDRALNIIRGDLPVDMVLRYNPLYKKHHILVKKIWKIFGLPFIKQKLIKYKSKYNLPYAILAKKHTTTPIITVGGIRSMYDINDIICNKEIDFISMCRPFICEPDFVTKALQNPTYTSLCQNCNRCTIMCDSKHDTQCYLNN